MWVLVGIREENQGQVHYIYESKNHIVSRKGGDVTLSNDQSISRLHARILHEIDSTYQIVITDMGSKYGTFAVDETGEKKQLAANEPVPFQSGSVIQFGLQWNAFRLENVPLVVCASMLSPAEKAELMERIRRLKGEMVNDWQANATHLTMNKITLTPKVLCALGSGKPIVSSKFWEAFCEAVENNRSLPSYEDFIPPLVERALLNKSNVSFKIDDRRRKLFFDKTFVTCCPAQKQRIGSIIIAAGGKVIAWTECDFTREELCDSVSIVMKPGPKDTSLTDGYHQLIRYLNDKGVRAVAESELGISIVYCSIEKYCNPLYDFASNSLKDSSLLPQSNASLLVPETQDSSKEAKHTEHKSVIPESAPLLTPVNKSRNKFTDSDEDESANGEEKNEKLVCDEPLSKRARNIATTRSEALGDLSRDVFSSLENPKPSTSRQSPSASLFSSASATSRKRPSAIDDEENIFDFGEDRLRRRQSGRHDRSSSICRSEQNENGIPSHGSSLKQSDSTAGSIKRPRLCIDDPDDVFNFPSERRSSTTVKRRISILDDEVDSENVFSDRGRLKRTRCEEPTISTESPGPCIKQSTSFSWSQEIKKIDDRLNAVGFISRQQSIKIEKQEDGEADNEDGYLKCFRDKAVIEARNLIPERTTKPVEKCQAGDGPNFKKFKKNTIFRTHVAKIMGKDCLRPFQLSENKDVWGNMIEEAEVVVDAFPDFEHGTRRVGRVR